MEWVAESRYIPVSPYVAGLVEPLQLGMLPRSPMPPAVEMEKQRPDWHLPWQCPRLAQGPPQAAEVEGPNGEEGGGGRVLALESPERFNTRLGGSYICS